MRNIYEEIKEYVDRGFRIGIEFLENNRGIYWNINYNWDKDLQTWQRISNTYWNHTMYSYEINIDQALDQIHHAMVRLPLSGE